LGGEKGGRPKEKGPLSKGEAPEGEEGQNQKKRGPLSRRGGRESPKVTKKNQRRSVWGG